MGNTNGSYPGSEFDFGAMTGAYIADCGMMGSINTPKKSEEDSGRPKMVKEHQRKIDKGSESKTESPGRK